MMRCQILGGGASNYRTIVTRMASMDASSPGTLYTIIHVIICLGSFQVSMKSAKGRVPLKYNACMFGSS